MRKNGDFQPLRHNLTREILLDNNKESLMGFGLVVVTTSAKPEDKMPPVLSVILSVIL